MIKIKNPYTQKTFETNRILGEYRGEKPGPQLLIFAAVHGNEPSGVFALMEVLNRLKEDRPPMYGGITGICGNLAALAQQQRYLDEDLNRLFTPDRINTLSAKKQLNAEEQEMKELLAIVDAYRELEEEVFFVDCHTTSSQTEPYISLNAGYANSYDFARGIPLCSVVGVEKILKGCLAEHLNRLDFHGFTYEAGQHDAKETIDCQEAMIWLALAHSGCLPLAYPPVQEADKTLSQYAERAGKLLKVNNAHAITEGEEFRMKEGFRNLDPVEKGQHLAWVNGEEIMAPAEGRILMPLYQKKGNFGFFLTEEIEAEAFAHVARENEFSQKA